MITLHFQLQPQYNMNFIYNSHKSSKYLQLPTFILSIINIATALLMPTLTILHEHINELLFAGATSIKPSDLFTDKLQAKYKQTGVHNYTFTTKGRIII